MVRHNDVVLGLCGKHVWWPARVHLYGGAAPSSDGISVVFWDPKLERISAEGRYIVKLETWKRAQKVLKSGDAVISTTVKGVNTMKLDEASTSADAVDTEVVMEELSFMSMKHKPRTHNVHVPAPGTRKMGK